MFHDRMFAELEPLSDQKELGVYHRIPRNYVPKMIFVDFVCTLVIIPVPSKSVTDVGDEMFSVIFETKFSRSPRFVQFQD